MEWQPIETAPKDGTKILIWGRGGARVVRWSLGPYNRKTRRYDEDWADGGMFGFEPTHWQPLPAPPKQD